MERKKRVNALLAVFLLLLTACGGGGTKNGVPAPQADTSGAAAGRPGAGKTASGGQEADSTARAAELRIAVLPTVDCLPFYYARSSGIYRKLGLDGVQLVAFASQMDADTALLRGRVQGGVTDLVRLQYYRGRGHRITGVAATDGRWELAVCKGLRIRKADKLKGRLVGISRLSASDYLSEVVLERNRLGYADVYRPQINDYALRAAMLNGNQIDAAVLPEPYATVARLAGHRLLPSTGFSAERTGVLAFRTSDLDRKAVADRVKLLLRGYDMAADSLNRYGTKLCADLLTGDFHLEKTVADSMPLPRYGHARLPRTADVENTRAFLKRRGQLGSKFSATRLLDGAFLP